MSNNTDNKLIDEVFLVLQKRRDAGLPAATKLMHAQGQQGLQFDKAAAFAAAEKINEELGGEFAAVYRCELTVVERVAPENAVEASAVEKN